jgi:hypothetical protein
MTEARQEAAVNVAAALRVTQQAMFVIDADAYAVLDRLIPMGAPREDHPITALILAGAVPVADPNGNPVGNARAVGASLWQMEDLARLYVTINRLYTNPDVPVVERDSWWRHVASAAKEVDELNIPRTVVDGMLLRGEDTTPGGNTAPADHENNHRGYV